MSDIFSIDLQFTSIYFTDHVSEVHWDSESTPNLIHPSNYSPSSSEVSDSPVLQSTSAEIINDDFYEPKWDNDSTASDVTAWIVATVDKVNDIVPFWLQGIEVQDRGEDLPKLSDFIDGLQRKHNEEFGFTELWESEARPTYIVWTEK